MLLIDSFYNKFYIPQATTLYGLTECLINK